MSESKVKEINIKEDKIEIRVWCPDEEIKGILKEIEKALKGSQKIGEEVELRAIKTLSDLHFIAAAPKAIIEREQPWQTPRPLPAVLLLQGDEWDDGVNDVLQSPHCDVRGIFRMSKLREGARDPEDFAALLVAVKDIIRQVLRSKEGHEEDDTFSKRVDWKARTKTSSGFISLFSDPAMRRMAREYKDALLDLEGNASSLALKDFRESGMKALEDLCQKEGNNGELLKECKKTLDKSFKGLKGKGFRMPSLLLLGETGCGKTLLAQSAAKVLTEKKFYKVNISACTASAIDGLLFGWQEGAFTSSVADSPGVFIAHCGKTVFLDEIGDMDAESQTRLLTYMDDGRVSPLGMGESIFAPCVLVAATNRNVDDPASGFRQDLVHRFDHVIRIPPLRERKQDLRLLISLTLQDDEVNPPDALKGDEARRVTHISLDAIEYLEAYDFPGNFRELRSILRRAVNNAFTEGASRLCLRHVIPRGGRMGARLPTA